jgi:hypothetical protein
MPKSGAATVYTIEIPADRSRFLFGASFELGAFL